MIKKKGSYKPAMPASGAKAPGAVAGKCKFGYKQFGQKSFSKAGGRAKPVKYN